MTTHIYKFLTDDGLTSDGTNDEMASAADKFYAGPAAGKYWVLHRMIMKITDSGNATVSTFGAASALTTGCKISIVGGGVDGTSKLDFLDGETIKTNGDFAELAYDVSFADPGAGNDMVAMRWTFSKSGKPVILSGDKAEKFVFQTQDSLTALVSMHCMIQGYEVTSLTGNE